MKPPEENGVRKDSEAINPSRGSSGHMIVREPQMGETTDQDGTQLVRKTKSSIPGRKATGPRTPAGKNRIKHNAVKHGIFSKVALLKNESRSEFDSLLKGIRNYFQPVGMLEEVLVEKLVVLLWRLRRLFVAETAEIQIGAAFVEWNEKERQGKEARKSHHNGLDLGFRVLMQKIENPQILGRCLEHLEKLKNDIEAYGFNSESDLGTLIELYGNGQHWIENLLETYRAWSDTAECSDQDREESGCASPKQCKINFLIEIENEIARLNRYKKARASVESETLRLESLRKNVPDSPQLDRLLRYETSLARDFERTLTQLERLQRARKEQPVLPPIRVDVCKV